MTSVPQGSGHREPSGASSEEGAVRRALLVVVSGPSGVGKGTVVDRLLELLPSVAASVSVTTRPPRPEEVEGDDYYFVDDEAFNQLIATGQLLEWASVHRARYGTPRRWVEERLAEGVDVLLEIDVQGALQVRREVSDALLILLAPPTREELARRLRTRGTESAQERAARLEAAQAELDAAPAFDRVVINDELDRCVEEIAGILRRVRL